MSPLVAYLAHEDCSVNGHVYSVAGGRMARIFVGETQGVVPPENTSEAVAGHLARIDMSWTSANSRPTSRRPWTTRRRSSPKALAEA